MSIFPAPPGKLTVSPIDLGVIGSARILEKLYHPNLTARPD